MGKPLFLIKSLNETYLPHGWAWVNLFILVFSACQDELDDQPFQQDEISNALMRGNSPIQDYTMGSTTLIIRNLDLNVGSG